MTSREIRPPMSSAPHSARELAGQRILVTGASGFLGTRLVNRLQGLGSEVHGVSRSDRGQAGHVRWWKADLQELREVERLWDAIVPTVVYHMSGAVDGAPHLELLVPTYQSLLTTTVNLLSVSTRRRCSRLILVGSLEEQNSEDAAAPPVSPYAAAKTAAREYARMCHQLFETHVVMMRTFMCYGPGQAEWKVVPSTIRALQAGVAPALSSGRRELDWIFIDDAVDAFAAAASAPGIDGTTLDIGSGRLTSIRDVVGHLVRLVNPGVEPRFGELPDRPGRPACTADTSRTFTHLGWRARTSIEDGLRRTVEACLAAYARGT